HLLADVRAPAPQLGSLVVEERDPPLPVGGVHGRWEPEEQVAEALLTLPQRLLGLLVLGDVFHEPGNARDVPVLVLDGEGAATHQADRAIRSDDPELRVGEHALAPLLQVRKRLLPIVRVDTRNPGLRLVVEGLEGTPPDLLVTRADVEHPL